MPAPAPSYASGPSTVPLLGDTIGDNFRRTVAAHADREALVDRGSDRRFSYAELADDGRAVRRSACSTLGVAAGDRVGIWSPNRWEWVVLQYATADIGAILVNINPAYRTHELQYVLGQAGISLLVSAPEFKTSDYRAMVGEVRAECPELRDVIFLGDPEWDGAAVPRRRPRGAGGPAGRALLRRPDQHPVHQRHHRLPQGRDAVAPQHPEQRLLRRASCAATPRRTGSASRCPSTTASAW